MKFRNSYSRKVSNGLVFDDPGLTQQHFKDECDINNIIAKYAVTGELVTASSGPRSLTPRVPMFGDFTDIPDYRESLDFIQEAGERFEALPSRTRRRFGNNPAELLEFLNNPNNVEEARALGLLAPAPKAEIAVEPVVVPDKTES